MRKERNTCFLCALDASPCAIPLVEGTLAGVREGAERGRVASIVLRLDDGARVTLLPPDHTRPLVRELAALPAAQIRGLRLRVYHLQPGPAATDISTRVLHAGAGSAVVLEPDLLLNITDINNAEYCARQYPLRRLISSPPTEATLRGTIVHQTFKELLKSGQPDPQNHLERALGNAAANLALRRIGISQMAEDAQPHVAALARWYASSRDGLWGAPADIRAETFRLSPEVGLKGRLDIWRVSAEGEAFIELKTGEVRAGAALPKREHRWQVQGYQTLLAVRRPGGLRPTATLLYSGTPGGADGYGVPFSLRELHRVLDLRNRLALLHATGQVPPPPSVAKCQRCMLRAECAQASTLLGWEPPASEDAAPTVEIAADAYFARLYEQLRLEARAVEREAARLWRRTAEERVMDGSAIRDLELAHEPRRTTSGEWEYQFRCRQQSELREGDAVLVSNGDPIAGEVVSGTLLRVDEQGVTVWTPERIACPTLIDRYDGETVHDRTVRNLWRWLWVDPHLRSLVAGACAPAFDAEVERATLQDISPRFNDEQRLAIARAMAARDFLLIQGPPGTGKTDVVAEIASRAIARGERVLIAAFTNQAVDTVLRRLVVAGVSDIVRLGHELSIAPEVRQLRLESRAASADGAESGASDPERILVALESARLVAATTATWSAERYDDAGEALRFDLAIVDEASQLTTPALLGALRFAHRFVLVGDEHQLPPLVVSEEAAEQGLRRSLFGMLLERWGQHASVALTRQYRMHPVICGFPSQMFYDSTLVAAGAARDSLLVLRVDLRLARVLDPTRPCVFVDVRDEAVGKVSQAQTKIASDIVRTLRGAGIAATHIGVITPYRAQAAAIRQRLATLGEHEVQVDTVDRFQGAEREAIIFASGGRASDTTRGRNFLADPHRLNVALTRAQRKLIILGDRQYFASAPLLAQLLEYCARLYDGQGGIVIAQRR
jgi:DNA replication ATP-dependent helicase Dna2